MARLSLVAILALCLSALALLVRSQSTVNKLQIGVKSRPEACTVKSAPGDKITVHYTGSLTDGTKFDSSLDRGDPFEFTLGAGQVIKGWDQGLNAMCVGEKRRLKIPSDLGYGAMGSPPKIPGGATLVFDVEMLKINGQA